MTDCYVIGIGGTGSKCAEAFVRLCAAGLGPERVTLALIDQDRSNGNLDRTRQLVDSYVGLQRRLRGKGVHRLPDDLPLLRTDIRVSDQGLVWCPIEAPGQHLRNLFRYDLLASPMQGLMNGLYCAEEEQELALDEGFRGRPGIGAAAILASASGRQPFWSNLLGAIDRAQQGSDVRIFLFGSIIGGTGAAGFPTLARLIRTETADRGARADIRLGGALMLPYFCFPSPRDAEGEGLVADSAAFLEQAQGALAYYHRVLGNAGIFDSLYLAGWDPLIEIKQFRKGGPDQCNPPLLPELYAALAAARFCRLESAEGPVLRTGRSEGVAVGWADLPRVDDDDFDRVRRQMAQFLRFCVAERYVYAPSFARAAGKKVSSESWYRRQIKGAFVDPMEPETATLLGDFDSFVEGNLAWWSDMVFASSAPAHRVAFLDASVFAMRQEDANRPATLLGSDRHEPLAGFAKLVADTNGASLAEIYDQLTYGEVADTAKGLGRYVAGLYRACQA